MEEGENMEYEEDESSDEDSTMNGFIDDSALEEGGVEEEELEEEEAVECKYISGSLLKWSVHFLGPIHGPIFSLKTRHIDIFSIYLRLSPQPFLTEVFLGNLYRLDSINVGPPYPTLVWSQHSLELATQQRKFA